MQQHIGKAVDICTKPDTVYANLAGKTGIICNVKEGLFHVLVPTEKVLSGAVTKYLFALSPDEVKIHNNN